MNDDNVAAVEEEQEPPATEPPAADPPEQTQTPQEQLDKDNGDAGNDEQDEPNSDSSRRKGRGASAMMRELLVHFVKVGTIRTRGMNS